MTMPLIGRLAVVREAYRRTKLLLRVSISDTYEQDSENKNTENEH
jgi:hypothetical protein